MSKEISGVLAQLNTQKELVKAAEKRNLTYIKENIQNVRLDTYHDILKIAVFTGNCELVKLLLTEKPSTDFSSYLLQAVDKKDIDIVKVFLSFHDQHPYNTSDAFLRAAFNGDATIVQAFLHIPYEQHEYNTALTWAVYIGLTDIIFPLLSVMDYHLYPKDHSSNFSEKYKFLQQCIEQYESQKLKTHLNNELGSALNGTVSHIKRKI